MKVNKAPCGVTHTVSIAKGNITSNDGADSVKGGILKGTKYAWLCQGPFLKIIDVSNGEKIAGWRFGAACSESITEVSCAVELPYNDDASTVKQIILGLECEVIGGMLCIFDVQGSRLLRAIRIPGKPLSLSIVDSGSSGCEGRYPLPGLLSSMSGIIAVGLQEGRVFLIDLCRVTCDELLNTWFNDDREEVHDELNPCQLLPINKDDDGSDKLEKKCASAAVSGDHLCLLLNENAFMQENFLLLEPGGEVSACFKSRNIGVTALLYVPRIASLVVGYSFGCFQLWNLMHLTLNYTSRLMKDPLPVLHLGFQEPSDDPCNFCYLWAVHSSMEVFPSSSPPVGIMYALSYDSKEWVDGYGYLYQDYQSCHFRFEYNLQVDTSDDVDSVSCVSFNTLSNVATQRNMPEDGYDEVTSENDFSLCIFVWEAYDSENKPISTYLSLFDLNQWYKDQMPVRVTEAEDENLGYLVTFSLNCIRQKEEEASQNETPLLDIQVDPQNLAQFKSFQAQEEHFHPSALSFVSHCLLEDKIVSLSHPGLQRYLLLYMEKDGPLCLLRPVHLFKYCMMVGLKPVLVDINGSTEVSAVTQREFLLSVALEHQMLGFLHRCASDWANGSVSGVECSLPMLLSWGFQRAVVLKETADGLCVHLFDHTGIRLDKNECRLLDNCASQLRQLATLFEGILSDCRLLSLMNLENIREKTSELNLVALYFEVLLWFLNVGLLPEFPENDFEQETPDICNQSVDKISYPVTVLTKFYTDRRLEFKNLNLKNGTKASLYIDQLLKNESNGSELAQLWQSDGGSGMYPPPSIQSLLAMYLQNGVDIQTKNSIVIYVFLDLANLLDTERYSQTIEYFVKFPCAFYMTPSIIKVTQAFWLLDHKLFEDALDMMLDPLVSPKDLQPWQHRFIVHALLSQGQHSKALEYFTVRQLPIQGIEDIQLKITLLVMNKQVSQAYNFLQQYHNEENNKDLLYHFYHECGKAQQLGTVLKLMLSPAEEDLLMNYLQNSSLSQSEDMQVVFYLMRSRVIEAVAVNERINFSGNRKAGIRRSTRNDPTVRDVLVGGYAKTLPSVTRQLANYCSQQKKSLSNWRQVQRPTPMSVDVHYGTKQAVSYKSSLIHATLEKARETWMMPVHGSYGSEAKNKEILDVSAMQNLPFLCTTHDTLRHDRETTPVVFPSVTSSVKRRLDDDVGSQSSTPSKRSRLESSPLMENFLLLSNKKTVHDHPANSSTLLLKSPLVKRVTPLKQFNDHSTREKNGSKTFAQAFTPQSILKVRNLIRSSISPEKPRVYADELTREQNKAKPNEERICARQIRFSLPAQNDVEEHSPLSSSTPDLADKKDKTSNRIVNASARLPLRSSLSLLQKPIVCTTEELTSNISTEKKSWIQKSSTTEMIQEGSFVFGSSSSSAVLSCTTDVNEMEKQDEMHKVNDSPGEESFYSATSSDSGTSKDYSKTDTDDSENSPSLDKGGYIHKIKGIKPRRQLSRLKSESQSSLDNICDQKEIVTDIETERKLCSSERHDVGEILRTESICKSHTAVESEVKQHEFSSEDEEDDGDDGDNDIEDKSESDENEDKIISVMSKKSLLGDTCIDINISTSSSSGPLTISLGSSETSNVQNDSIENVSPVKNDETTEGTEESSIAKIQQIKARRPLSRVRKSGFFDTSRHTSFEMEKSSYLESTKNKEDVLLDDTTVELSDTEERLVNVRRNRERLNESDDETLDVEAKSTDNAIKYRDILKENKTNVSPCIQLESDERVQLSISRETRSHLMWTEKTIYSEENIISRGVEKETYIQESHNDLVRKEYACQESNIMEGNVREEETAESSNAELSSDHGKTYASLSTITAENTSYEELPFHHSDVNQRIDVCYSSDTRLEDQGNLLVLNPTEDGVFSVGIDHVILIQDSSSTTGDTSGTIQLDSDESEETNTKEINILKPDPIQHMTKCQTENVSEDCYVVKEGGANLLLSAGKDTFDENEITCVDLEECKIISIEQRLENQGTSSEGNTNPDNLDGQRETNEGPLILELSDKENDSESSSSEEETEEHPEAIEKIDNGTNRSSQSNVILVDQLTNASSVRSLPEMAVNRNENNGCNKESYGVVVTTDDSKYQSDETMNFIDNVENKHSYRYSEQQSVSNEAVPDFHVLKQSGTDVLGEHYSLKHKQRRHPSSIQSEPPKMADVLEHDVKNQVVETLQAHSGQVARPRRRRSSLHIEPLQTGIDFVSERKDAVATAEEILAPRTRQRSQPSSVQSEPPQMDDVTEIEHQSSETSQKHSDHIGRQRTRQSSQQIEPQQTDIECVSENKDTVPTTEEIFTPRTRQRSRPSSVQSEPPQMTDVTEIEHQSSVIAQKHSVQIGRPRRRQSSHQIKPQQTDIVGVSENKDTVAAIEEMFTPRTRQRSRPSSVQSEPPQMADVTEFELQNSETSRKPDQIGLRRRKSSHQIEPRQTGIEVASENQDPVAATEEMFTPRTRQRNRQSSVQSEPPLMTDVTEIEHQSSETLQEHSDQIGRPRRRRSSLQIVSQQIYDDSILEEKDSAESVGEKSTPRTSQKSRPSSVQSNLPQMADVLKHAPIIHNETSQNHSGQENRPRRRRNSHQFDSQLMSGEPVSKLRDDFVIEENFTPKTRQRSRPRSVQSESPQIADAEETEQRIETSHKCSEPILRPRRSSLQIEPQQLDIESAYENRDCLITTGEISMRSTRQRSRPSSVQSEPPLMTDVLNEGNESLDQSFHKRTDTLQKARRRRSSLRSEHTVAVTATETEIKESFTVVEGSHTPRTIRSQPSSINDESSVPEMPSEDESLKLHENEKQESKVLEETSLTTDEPQPSTSFVHDEVENKMNLRSRRAYSVDRELPKTKGSSTCNTEIFSDSDGCSVQSEPPQLRDVSLVKKLRNMKSRRGSLKKKSRKTGYMLKIQPPVLPCVDEEPEIEAYIGDGYIIERPAVIESEVSPAFISTRYVRHGKHSASASSQASSVGERRMLRYSHEDNRDDSSVSISSKSTVIRDQSSKRKRCFSTSSPEEPEVKKFLKNEDSTITESVSEKQSDSKGADADDIEQYATARRLTRYQKTLMERSMETTKSIRRQFQRRHQHDHSERSEDDSDRESVASGYTSTSSQVRSSARLLEKRQVMDRSPSQSSVLSVGGDRTPQKRNSKLQPQSVEHVETSPASVPSGRSPSYASSASSSQWPSPSSHPPSPLKPRRKSFQHAQKALSSPSAKTRSSKISGATDSSDAESFGESDERVSVKGVSKKDVDIKSDAGSQSSAMSSSVSRSTRSSAKHIETMEFLKSRETEGEPLSHVDAQLQRKLRQRKETSSDVSSSTEDSPEKKESRKGATRSEDIDHRTARELQEKQERRKFSVFKKRQYLRLHSKRKTTM